VRLQEGLGLLFGRLRDGAEQAPSLQEHFAVAIQELQAMSQLDGSVQPLRDQALDLEAGINDYFNLSTTTAALWTAIMSDSARFKSDLPI